jgi:hypothetical protein
MSEKPMLREWRQDFAKYLPDVGVEANATERAVRGETLATKRDGIHRAMLRGESTHMRARANVVARELAAGGLTSESGKRVLLETRKAVLDGWRGLAVRLERDGNPQLASTVRRSMRPNESGLLSTGPQPESELAIESKASLAYYANESIYQIW